MAAICKITGMSTVLNNLKKSKVIIGDHVEKGLKKAGLFLQRESKLVTPVDTGNLVGGAFTRNIGGSGFYADIVVGYLAAYAVYVHEILDNAHKEGKKAKFLEGPAREKKNEILQIVKEG